MKDFSRLSIRKITKHFGDKKALHEFSLEVNKGEFVTFLGPSGCGKSTALNCVTGLLPLSGGEVFIDEECLDGPGVRVPPEKRQFGMVFQNYALFPHLNVFKNVAFGLQLRKLAPSIIAQKVDAALKLVHLEGYDLKFPSQMSGGEQQRLAIARCVVLEPRLLLLDEPLSNLDAKLRLEMRYELMAIQSRLGVTTIYVTHDQEEALALSDKIVVMRLGVIQQVGIPQQIYSDPANLFVADFMGFKNLWPAQITKLEEIGDELLAFLQIQGSKLEARLSYPAGDARRMGLIRAFEGGEEVTTAIRPSDLQETTRSTQTIPCQVIVSEYLGQSTLITAVTPEGVTVDFKSDRALESGETVHVGVAPNKVLLFSRTEA